MTNCEIKTCPKCWRPVSCQYDGDSYVGQCHWCGKMIAYQYCPKPEPTEPAPKPKLLGVQVDYWDDDLERGPRRSRFFEDPDEGLRFEEECKSEHLNTIVWPVWEEVD